MDSSFSFTISNNLELHKHIGENLSYTPQNCPICNAPKPPLACDECGRTGPDIDIRQTQEGDSIWGPEMEDELWWDDEYHCADCRKKLDKEPVD